MTDIATTAARLLIEAVLSDRPRRIHLAVITESRKQRPAVSYHWQRMNAFGVSFTKRDVTEAEAWAVTAMRAGYCPFHFVRKGGFGTCPNDVRKLLERGA